MNSRYHIRYTKEGLPFVLGIVVNLVLILLVEVMLIYSDPAVPTAADFARIHSRYENCTILDDSGGDKSSFYLVLTQSGEQDLIPVQQHIFFPGRGRIHTRKIIRNVDEKQGELVNVFFGLQTQQIAISENRISLQMQGGGFHNNQAALVKYFLIAGIFTFLELYLWEKIRGNL